MALPFSCEYQRSRSLLWVCLLGSWRRGGRLLVGATGLEAPAGEMLAERVRLAY